PRSTRARTPGSLRTAASTARSSVTMARLMALRLSGRFRVTCSTPAACSSSRVSQFGRGMASALLLARQDAHQLADDAQHDFVGAAAEGHQAGIAVGAGNVVVPHEAHAAPVLQAGVADFAAEAAGLELGHGGEASDVLAGDVELHRLVDQG